MTISLLNSADYAILAILALSTFVSIARGFIREALSLVAWVAALWVSMRFTTELANHLQNQISSPLVRLGVSFAVTFFGTLIVGALLIAFVATLVDVTGLTSTDRLLGMLFGLTRGVLVVLVLLMLARITPLKEDPWWQHSQIIPRFEPLEMWLQKIVQTHFSEYLQASSDFMESKRKNLHLPPVSDKESHAVETAISQHQVKDDAPTTAVQQDPTAAPATTPDSAPAPAAAPAAN